MRNANKTPPAAPHGGTWTLAGAKARLSEVVDRAQAGPQTITRNGKPSAVIVSAEEWARKTVRKGTLAEFLLASGFGRAAVHVMVDILRRAKEIRSIGRRTEPVTNAHIAAINHSPWNYGR